MDRLSYAASPRGRFARSYKPQRDDSRALRVSSLNPTTLSRLMSQRRSEVAVNGGMAKCTLAREGVMDGVNIGGSMGLTT